MADKKNIVLAQIPTHQQQQQQQRQLMQINTRPALISITLTWYDVLGIKKSYDSIDKDIE